MMPCNTGAFSVGHLRKCSYSSVPQKGKRDISQFLSSSSSLETRCKPYSQKIQIFLIKI